MNGTPSYIGRTRLPRCDTTLIRGWIDRCSQEHTCCSNAAKSSADVPIHLIDVHQYCLRTFETAGGKYPLFLALSYVWGNSGQTYLGRNKNSFRHGPGESESPGILEE
jgi:hypothetical protein